MQAASGGGIVLGTVNNNNVSINTAAVAGTTTIGGTATTGTITLGQYNGASTSIINIGANAGASTTQQINIGSSASGVSTLTLGSANSTSTTTIKSGTGNINLNPSGSSNTGVTVKPTNDSTFAFQIQNAAGTSNLLIADTTNTRIGIGTAGPAQALDVVGSVRASVAFRTNTGIVNDSSQNNARVQTIANGTVIDRNIADSNAALIVQQLNASSTGDILQLKNDSATVATVSQSGAALFKNSTNSNAAFQIQNAGAADTLFTADTSLNKLVIGNSTGTNANTTLLVLDSATADPTTGYNGASYYNTSTNKFRCYQNSAWTDCIGAGGGGSTLAASYTAGSSSTDQTLLLTNADGGGLVLKDDSTPITGSLFTVQSNGGTKFLDVDASNVSIGTTLNIGAGTGIGQQQQISSDGSGQSLRIKSAGATFITSCNVGCPNSAKIQIGGSSPEGGTVLHINETGAALFQNSVDSATAFQIQNSTGGNILTADTTNSNVIVSNLTPETAGITLGTTTAVVDSVGNVGQYPSMAIASDGFARIAYSEYDTNSDKYNLKYAQCTNSSCTTSNVQTVESTNYVSARTVSMVLGTDDRARIVYGDSNTDDVLFVRCTSDDCSTKVTTTIDNTDYVESAAVALYTSDTFARIVYSDDGILKFVQCGNDNCTSPTINTVDGGVYAQGISITLDSSGYGQIAYGDDYNDQVKFARCTNSACSSPTINVVDGDANFTGWKTKIVLGGDGYPRIGYFGAGQSVQSNNSALWFAQCTATDCGTKNISYITDTIGQNSATLSLALGADGLARLSYVDYQGLNYVRCIDIGCSVINKSKLVDSPTSYTYDLAESMVIPSDGYPRIAYFDLHTNDLVFMQMGTGFDDHTTAGSNIGSATDPFANLYTKNVQTDYLSVRPAYDSANFVQIQNSAGSDLFVADSISMQIKTGNLSPISSSISTYSTTPEYGANVIEYTQMSSSSVAFGPDGSPRVSYYDYNNGYLKFALPYEYNGGTIVDSSANISSAQPTALTVDSNGFGLIAYQDTSNGYVRFAQCTNTDCSSSNQTNVATGVDPYDISIALGNDDFARIVYTDDNSGNVEYIQCTNAACTTKNTHTVDSGYIPSLAIGLDGYARIAYISSGNMYLASCDNDSCSSNQLRSFSSSSPDNNLSLAINPISGNAVITYDDNNDNTRIKVIACTDSTYSYCDSYTKNTIPGTLYSGRNRVAIGSDGIPQIAFSNYVTDITELKYAKCSDEFCDNGIVSNKPFTVDYNAAYGTGNYPSISIGPDNHAIITYTDGTNNNLRYALIGSDVDHYVEGISLGSATDTFANLHSDNVQAKSLSVQSNSASILSVKDASGDSALNVDTLNHNISLNGGNSANLTTWISNPYYLTTAVDNHGVVAANGYVYSVGGDTGGFDSTPYAGVSYSRINADGSLASFNSTTSLPQALACSSVVAANGFIYSIGGWPGSSNIGTVYYARINSDGSLGTWKQNKNSLSYGTCLSAAAASNGYIYVLGGYDGSYKNNVSYAKLNPDGSTGSFTSSGNTLWTGMNQNTAVILNGVLYNMGGKDGGSAYSYVYAANIDPSNGSVGSWYQTGSLPNVATNFSAVTQNGYIYVLWDNQVWYAKPDSSGEVIWQYSNNYLPQSRATLRAVASNGYIYVVGGYIGGPTSSIIYTSTPRTQVAGALDLVGITGQELNYNSIGSGATLTAGNTRITGNLEVQGQAQFSQNVSIDNLGVGSTSTSGTSLAIIGGALQPAAGNSSSAGIYFGADLYGGSGDEAWIRYFLQSGEDTKLQIGNNNDANDVISFYQAGADRLTIGNGSVDVASAARVLADSTNAFRIQNAAGSSTIFSADTSNNRIYIGNPTPDTTGVSLVLDNKTDSSDPTGTAGAMYYNSNLGSFRCYTTAWTNCSGGGLDNPASLFTTWAGSYKSSNTINTSTSLSDAVSTIGSDGLTRLAYIDGVTNDLIFQRCFNATCTDSNTNDVGDSTAGQDPSISMGTDGLPRLVYSDNGSLTFIQCQDAYCWNYNSNVIDGSSWAYNIAMSIGEDGYARMVYIDDNNGYLKYIKCSSDDCTTNTPTTLSTTNATEYPSIAMGKDGYARIAYGDAGDIPGYIQCLNDACSSVNSDSTFEPGAGIDFGTAIAVRSDGNVVMAYDDSAGNDMGVIICYTNNCSNYDLYQPDDFYPRRMSLTLNSKDVPTILSENVSNNDIRAVICESANYCGDWNNYLLTNDGYVDSIQGLNTDGNDFARAIYMKYDPGDDEYYLTMASISPDGYGGGDDTASTLGTSVTNAYGQIFGRYIQADYLSIQPTTDTTTAFQIQNSSGSPLLTADTIHNKIKVSDLVANAGAQVTTNLGGYTSTGTVDSVGYNLAPSIAKASDGFDRLLTSTLATKHSL